MASDQYFVDEQPSVRGGPSATGANPSSGNIGGMMKQDMGPLPLWGWIAVAVAAVFIYRRLSSSGSSSGTSAGVSDSESLSPSQAMGGVFLLPSSGGGTGGASSSSNTSSTVDANKAATLLAQQIWNQSAMHASDPGMTLEPLAGNGSGGGFVGNPKLLNQVKTGEFMADNAAKSQLGLPYFTGKFDSAGNAAVYDPSNGSTAYINPTTGKVFSS